jgi:hypothetical protein
MLFAPASPPLGDELQCHAPSHIFPPEKFFPEKVFFPRIFGENFERGGRNILIFGECWDILRIPESKSGCFVEKLRNYGGK